VKKSPDSQLEIALEAQRDALTLPIVHVMMLALKTF